MFFAHSEEQFIVKHTHVARLIEAADPEQLKQIARLALKLSGYADTRISDGPYDDGADLVIAEASGKVLPLPVAVSVERDSRKKIRGDAAKIGSKLRGQRLLFISSRRIPEGSFRTVQAELRDGVGVDVDRLDQQGIANLVMDHEALSELLEVLEIPIAREHLPTRPVDRRRDLAYAYAFFAPEVRSFRKDVRDRGLLVGLARNSELGQSLALGSVYQALTQLNRDALLRALDARSIAFVLDASVAIPMFCALFHGSVQQRFFIVAEELHRRSKRAGIALQLPDVWLEEMAAHLLGAREYVALVSEEDLRQSSNAYVAYFAAARRSGRAGDFQTFLTELGLTQALGRRADIDFVGARRELEVFLRRQLTHYGIAVVPTPATRRHLDQAAREWAWACHELGIGERAAILARHDRRVLAWLSATTEADPTHAPLVTTWDRVLRRARPQSAPGGALDPLATTELLSFVAGAREPAMTARFASLQLTEAEAERGSAILDALISIEHERLSDAALSQKAREFKQAYLRDQELQSSAKALERAWKDFQG